MKENRAFPETGFYESVAVVELPNITTHPALPCDLPNKFYRRANTNVQMYTLIICIWSRLLVELDQQETVWSVEAGGFEEYTAIRKAATNPVDFVWLSICLHILACVYVCVWLPTLQNKLSAWIFLGKLETPEETNGSENSTIRRVNLKDWKNTASELHRLPGGWQG